MRSKKDKEKFLEILKELPIISATCKRASINKATIYRWRASDEKFDDKVNKAIELGRDSIAELAESKLFVHINRGEPWAIRYFLEANSKRYYKPRKPERPLEPDVHIAQIIYEVVANKEPTEPTS